MDSGASIFQMDCDAEAGRPRADVHRHCCSFTKLAMSAMFPGCRCAEASQLGWPDLPVAKSHRGITLAPHYLIHATFGHGKKRVEPGICAGSFETA